MKKNALFFLAACIATVVLGTDSENIKIEDFLFTAELADGSSGSAFLMKDTDGVWMVSNYHVIVGKRPVKFINMRDSSRVQTLSEEIEVAEDRDAVRFRVAESNGFAVTGNYSFDEPVYAFGNSGGLGVVTKNEGKIIGQGRAEIEVTCELIEGNSGGPVLNDLNEVVGIATFLVKPRKTAEILESFGKTVDSKEGTRYENIRRFAIPVHDIVWQKVKMDIFEEESAQFQGELEKCKSSLAVCAMMCLRFPITEEMAEHLLRPSVIRKYNRDVVPRYFPRNYSFVNPENVIKDNDKIFKDLAEGVSEWNDDFRKSIEPDFTIRYFSNRLNDTSRDIQESEERIVEAFKSKGR